MYHEPSTKSRIKKDEGKRMKDENVIAMAASKDLQFRRIVLQLEAISLKELSI